MELFLDYPIFSPYNDTGNMGSSILNILKENSRPLQVIPTGIPPSVYPVRVDGVFFDVYGTLFISQTGDIGISAESSDPAAFYQSLYESGFLSVSGAAGIEGKKLFFSAIKAFHEGAKNKGTAYPEVDILLIWETVIRTLSDKGYLTESYDTGTVMEVAARYESLSNLVYPMPGMVETLDSLKAADIPVGIVSNAQFFTPLLFPAILNQSIPQLGIRENLCVWSYQEGEAKPSANLFHTALHRLSLSHPSIRPENLLYVGNDVLNDIKAAGEAGFKTVLFAGDTRSYRSREEDPRCRDCSPDFIINDLLQLKNIWYIEPG